MKVSELARLTGLENLTPGCPDAEIKSGYTSDLLSDILGNAGESAVIITIQAHKNTAAVAFQISAAAIVLCNGRQAPEDMLAAAKSEGISVLRTRDNQFEASFRIHQALFGRA